MIVLWLAGLVAVVRLHLPPLWAKADIGLAAVAWAAHVIRVTLHNRASDRESVRR